jgi:hypothetical protein
VAGTLYIPVCAFWLGSSVKKLNNKATLKRGGARSAPGVGVGTRQRELLNYGTRAPGQAKTNPPTPPPPKLPLIHTNTYTIQNSVAGAFKLLFKFEELHEMTRLN